MSSDDFELAAIWQRAENQIRRAQTQPVSHRLMLEIPVRTRSMANVRMHWARKARLTREERVATAGVFRDIKIRSRLARLRSVGWYVMLIRVAPRGLDDDNLRPALKAVRDEVTKQLGFDDDRDRRLSWDYAQLKGKPKEYAVRVALIPSSPEGLVQR